MKKPSFSDFLIVGSGPAGLQLAYYMQEAGCDYLVLESADSSGGFFKHYPRHRKLISVNKCHTGYKDPELNLRMDWNSLLSEDNGLLFSEYSKCYFPHADDMVRYLNDFAAKYALNVKYGAAITAISQKRQKNNQSLYTLTDSKGEVYQCRVLIVATGVSKFNKPDFPGAEWIETYDTVSVDPMDFINQKVLVIGKGNSAFETADNLVETATAIHVAGESSIRMAWKTHFVGHLRAVNNNFLDTYQLKSQNAILDGVIQKAEKINDKLNVTFYFSRASETKVICYDRIIACTGFRFNNAIFNDSCKPAMTINDRFPAMTAQWESTNVPDLYFAGTIMQSRDYNHSTSGFIHGFRYCVRTLSRILLNKYHSQDLPSGMLPLCPTAIAHAIIDRVNRSSALWQQFEFFSDVVHIDGKQARYYEELPIAYARDVFVAEAQPYFLITLEYGARHADVDPFDLEEVRVRQNDSENAQKSHYLHPVVRCHVGSAVVDQLHLAENLDNNWTSQDDHYRPLKTFISRNLAVNQKVSEGSGY